MNNSDTATSAANTEAAEKNDNISWEQIIKSKEEAIQIFKHLIAKKQLTAAQIQSVSLHLRYDEATNVTKVTNKANIKKFKKVKVDGPTNQPIGKKRKLHNPKPPTPSKSISNPNYNADANAAVTTSNKTHNQNQNRHLTRHIALRFHYDGSTYTGLAENVNSPTDQSVERTLFHALNKTCLISDKYNDRSSCGYSRSGRTDKGVSAFGQVIALRVNSAFPIGTKLLLPKHQKKEEVGEDRGGEESVKRMCIHDE